MIIVIIAMTMNLHSLSEQSWGLLEAQNHHREGFIVHRPYPSGNQESYITPATNTTASCTMGKVQPSGSQESYITPANNTTAGCIMGKVQPSGSQASYITLANNTTAGCTMGRCSPAAAKSYRVWSRAN